MAHSAKILLDSISPDGVRLTTMEACFPRIVLAEFNTHRWFSRNSASSRAIPVAKMIRMVQDNPYIPTHWGKNQKGMQAEQEVDAQTALLAISDWNTARDYAVHVATHLLELGIHKQITNRLLEPFMFHTVIVTATEWDNYFHLRCHPAAHPDIRKVAELMRDALAASVPKEQNYGAWHLPLIDPAEVDETVGLGMSLDESRKMLCKISVGRCARVSYLTHDGKRDLQADINLCDALLKNGHMSPFEHVARPIESNDLFKDYVSAPSTGGARTEKDYFSGNFRGWVQYRKTIPGEADMLGGENDKPGD